MPDPINLRQARKARARAEKEAQASANRAKFGRTKAERKQVDATEALQQRRLDEMRLDQPTAPPKSKGGG